MPMQAVFLIAVLIALLAMNWTYLGLDKIFRRKPGGGGIFSATACRWRKDPRRTGGELDRWICAKCGVDAYTATGRAPDGCKRHLRSGGL
ncbi:MAG: hypothetical protein MRY74_15230 [Neomegalonema sp.]|nr:hypothetical protein [Neomegalonema sp.]